jgi:hypothetical protein
VASLFLREGNASSQAVRPNLKVAVTPRQDPYAFVRSSRRVTEPRAEMVGAQGSGDEARQARRAPQRRGFKLTSDRYATKTQIEYGRKRSAISSRLVIYEPIKALFLLHQPLC